MKNEKYKFSVITPIYNVEKYLEEAIESVIDQTIGFSNIQFLLVNDGSPDNSYKICERYQSEYPENILYIKKENGGVSSARNEGLKHAEGSYVVFLDGDDTWDKEAFQKIASFFEKYGDAFDVCSCRIQYSGDYAEKTHPLDYKFTGGEKVVDLSNDPVMISSTIGNAVFRRTAISSASFTEGLSVGEDSLFVNTVLINKPVLGVLPDAVFYYRRNISEGSGSSSAPARKSWYMSVPQDYYVSLCERSIEKFGSVVPFIQHVILYDMQWRFNRTFAENNLTDEEKRQYMDVVHKIIKDFDPDVIRNVRELSQYKKLYYYNLKYGYDVIEKAELKGKKYYFNDLPVFSLWGKSVLKINTLEVKNNILRLSGKTGLTALRRDYKIFATDELGNEYELKFNTVKDNDLKGFIGETISETQQFTVEIPIHVRSSISFAIQIDGNEVQLRPSFDDYIGLNHCYKNSFTEKDGYIIKYRKCSINFYAYSLKMLLASELRLIRELRGKNEKDLQKELLRQRIRWLSIHGKPRNRAAFISVRSDEDLLGNMAKVYDSLKIPKQKMTKLRLNNYPDLTYKAARMIYSSKIVVTDDYLTILRDYGKNKDQKVIQLWHAAGAGKHFGLDVQRTNSEIDALYHRDYDIVTVSSEGIRVVYASAFGIPVERVVAAGVARTDEFYDSEYKKRVCSSIFEKHPVLKGKQVILYTPTFRDLKGVSRSVFRPELDFDQLSENLRADQIFVIRPHPVMTAPILKREYDNIIEMRDVSTNDMMFVSDLMITDYSSTMFEYSLLKKPMAFFCYDYDEYDRDFYLDFETELPGPILRTQEELFDFLKKKEYPLLSDYERFYNKYMSACDGHSTERIVKLIEDIYRGNGR